MEEQAGPQNEQTGSQRPRSTRKAAKKGRVKYLHALGLSEKQVEQRIGALSNARQRKPGRETESNNKEPPRKKARLDTSVSSEEVQDPGATSDAQLGFPKDGDAPIAPVSSAPVAAGTLKDGAVTPSASTAIAPEIAEQKATAETPTPNIFQATNVQESSSKIAIEQSDTAELKVAELPHQPAPVALDHVSSGVSEEGLPVENSHVPEIPQPPRFETWTPEEASEYGDEMFEEEEDELLASMASLGQPIPEIEYSFLYIGELKADASLGHALRSDNKAQEVVPVQSRHSLAFLLNTLGRDESGGVLALLDKAAPERRIGSADAHANLEPWRHVFLTALAEVGDLSSALTESPFLESR